MYKVIIIGSGSIGALKDVRYDNKNSKEILTHAHAIHNHHLFEMAN